MKIDNTIEKKEYVSPVINSLEVLPSYSFMSEIEGTGSDNEDLGFDNQ